MIENEVGDAIVSAAFKVHSVVGPGLLEGAYEICMLRELQRREVAVRAQVMIPIRYKDVTINNAYRLDRLVEDRVVVELKTVQTILPIHKGQLLSYLRLGGFKLGYLLNFHVAQMRGGIVRMVNGL